MIQIVILLVLGISLWKWWTYRCFCRGLIYFAKIEHGWNITDQESKKILEYSIKRELKDFFN